MTSCGLYNLLRLIVIKLNIKIKKKNRFNTREIDADTSFKIEKQILTNEIGKK
jgi:hypothetical protein